MISGIYIYCKYLKREIKPRQKPRKPNTILNYDQIKDKKDGFEMKME